MRRPTRPRRALAPGDHGESNGAVVEAHCACRAVVDPRLSLCQSPRRMQWVSKLTRHRGFGVCAQDLGQRHARESVVENENVEERNEAERNPGKLQSRAAGEFPKHHYPVFTMNYLGWFSTTYTKEFGCRALVETPAAEHLSPDPDAFAVTRPAPLLLVASQRRANSRLLSQERRHPRAPDPGGELNVSGV
jgi:acetolactate synthase regulatory subunit